MALTAKEISEILKIDENLENDDFIIKYLIFDTRKIIFPENSIFFAINGIRRDGHDFIEDAYNKGIRFFVVNKKFSKAEKFTHGVFYKVENTLKALQLIAKYHRSKFDIPVLGITGSNGKTILKEWIYYLLTPEYNVTKSPGSYNSQIGVPLSVWQINENSEIALIEAGISEPAEMLIHQEVIRPTIGLITNLGDAHDAGFKNIEQKLEEKIILFKECNKIVCCADDEEIYNKLAVTYGKEKILSWTLKNNPESDFLVKVSNEPKKGVTLLISKDSKESKVIIPFNDFVSIRLSIYAYVCSIILGANEKIIIGKLSSLNYPRMRMEIERGINNCTLINDTYNSDLESLKNALNYLKNLKNDRLKTLILSDLNFSETNESSETKLISEMILESGISKVVLVGDKVCKLRTFLANKIHSFCYAETDQFLSELDNHLFSNENILLKGSRKFQFEKIFVRLSESLHKTQLIIDFEALDHNINIYRSYLKSVTKLMAVVKASGYGAGAIKLAEHFQKAGIDYLSVAFLDEGIELRKAGIKLPIMIFNPDMDYIDKMVKYDLEPVIYSFSQIDILKEKEIENFKFHIKLDTGMRRLGFDHKEIKELCKWISSKTESRIVSVFSHLAASNDSEFDDFTQNQFYVFESMYEIIRQSVNYRPMKHILNSSGIVRFPDHQYEMVRLGSGMHGVDISHLISEKLEPVYILKTKISQIKELDAGEGFGYNLKGVENTKRRIAIIPVGYADGLLRQAGNGRYKVWINGNFVPVVGDVNMDMSFVDITGLHGINTGDYVEVFGKNAKIEDLAKAGNTIFYEILSKISLRIKRVYSA
jgi:Alr-MurF fusion protein